MEDILSKVIWHNTLEHWLISAGIVLVTALFAGLLYRVLDYFMHQIARRTPTKLDDLILEQIRKPAILGIILTGLWFALERLHFTDTIDRRIHKLFIILTAINLTWAIGRILSALIREFLEPYAQKDTNSLDVQRIKILQQITVLLVWALGLITGLHNAGFDVAAFLAGLGIGGIAIALAAQDTVKNMLGGLILFLDKPFRIGDRIIIEGFDGFVQDIGLRSTRIRTLEGRIVTIPNAHFSEKPIENITTGPSFRVVTDLGLVYDTPYDKMLEALRILNELAAGRPELEPDSTAFFESYKDFSLNIRFVYFVKPNIPVFPVRNDINLEILRRFREAGLEFAFPTHTVYLEKEKLDIS